MLRLFADPDNLPFSSASGPERGFYLDVGALLAARLGMTTDVVWWRSFYGARAGRNTLLADTCDPYGGLHARPCTPPRRAAPRRRRRVRAGACCAPRGRRRNCATTPHRAAYPHRRPR